MNDLQKFEPLQAEISQFVAPALQIVVTDFGSSADAIETAKVIKTIQKKVTEVRRSLVDPLNEEVKKINAYAAELMRPLNQVEDHVRYQLNAFAGKQEEIRKSELRRLEEERRQAERELREKQEAERLAMKAGAELFGLSEENEREIEEKQRVESAILDAKNKQAIWDAKQFQVKNTRTLKKVKIVNLDLVPKEFLIIEVNTKAALAAMKAGVKISGLELEDEVSVAIGEKTRVPLAALEERGA